MSCIDPHSCCRHGIPAAREPSEDEVGSDALPGVLVRQRGRTCWSGPVAVAIQPCAGTAFAGILTLIALMAMKTIGIGQRLPYTGKLS